MPDPSVQPPEGMGEINDEMIRRVGAFIANEIRCELVCCDVYERLGPTLARFGGAFAEVTDGLTCGHSICYWGEVAARIAENPVEEDPDV